jgi:hypothetical protein
MPAQEDRPIKGAARPAKAAAELTESERMGKTPALFAVVRFAGGWRVLAQGRRLARLYDYRVDAEEAAVRLATAARICGELPEILVQEPHGELRRLVV